MIYVQIAAFRDPELLPTIKDCVAKAEFPEDLSFGICWQYGEEASSSLNTFDSDTRFKIEKIPWQSSRGVCWARSKIQKMYDGEDFTLQIDSKHRFAEGWDRWLRETLSRLPSRKAILSSYAGPYTPGTGPLLDDRPRTIVARKITDEGPVLFAPQPIENYENLEFPVRARFVSGHYYFSLGDHCQEYQYDPELCPAGDEISLSVRSYTLGYDLFHPHRNMIWHEYSRQSKGNYWDNGSGCKLKGKGDEEGFKSMKRLRTLLGMEGSPDELGDFGLGDTRTLHEYEKYAGLDFQRRRIQKGTLHGDPPPVRVPSEEDWEEGFGKTYELRLKWDRRKLRSLSRLRHIYFVIEDKVGNEIHRFDAYPGSPEFELISNEKCVGFQSAVEPDKLIIWPYLLDGSRGPRIEGEW